MTPEMEALIDQVVSREWEFFRTVNNTGGPAGCQSMPATFSVARRSQYATWSEDAVASWLDDLIAYGEQGANPLTFKYGYMMETTHPDEFEGIKHLLPEVSDEKRDLVDRLVEMEVAWADDLAERYPHYAARSRPQRTSSDSTEWTSTETYARAEFSTYSENTLKLLLTAYRAAAERGENLTETTATAQVRAYGYETLADADRIIAEGRMSSQGLDG